MTQWKRIRLGTMRLRLPLAWDLPLCQGYSPKKKKKKKKKKNWVIPDKAKLKGSWIRPRGTF